MDSQLEDKLIKKSAVVAGIVFVGAVTSISAFSQWNPHPATLSSSITQSPSKTQTALLNPPVAQSTIPNPVPPSKTTPVATATPSSTIPNKSTLLNQATSNISATPDDDTTTPSKSSSKKTIALNSSNQEDTVNNDASATASGLLEAKRKGKIQPDTTTWRKAQTAISLLRQGKTRRQAAREAGISKTTLKRLIELGQRRASTRGSKNF